MAKAPRRNWHPLPTTHWSLVAGAGDDDPEVRRAALGRLVERYQPALKSHLIHRKRLSEDEAEDLLQSFIAEKVLERDLFSQADQARGRFRTFILTCLERYFFNERVAKRNIRHAAVEEVPEPASALAGPDASFDIPWARRLLAEAVRLTKEESVALGRDAEWGLFEARVLQPIMENAPPPSYEELVQRFDFKSPAEGTNLLVTAKRRFARVLRSLVAEYAEGDSAVEAEIADLAAILGGR